MVPLLLFSLGFKYCYVISNIFHNTSCGEEDEGRISELCHVRSLFGGGGSCSAAFSVARVVEVTPPPTKITRRLQHKL